MGRKSKKGGVYVYVALPWWPRGQESTCNAGDAGDSGSIPGSGRSPEGGHGNPLQYSCLENAMDRGVWWATVHGVAKSRTHLKQLSLQAHVYVWLIHFAGQHKLTQHCKAIISQFKKKQKKSNKNQNESMTVIEVIEVRLWLLPGWEILTRKGPWSFLGWGNVWLLDLGGSYTGIKIFKNWSTSTLQIWVSFTIIMLYFNKQWI